MEKRCRVGGIGRRVVLRPFIVLWRRTQVAIGFVRIGRVTFLGKRGCRNNE